MRESKVSKRTAYSGSEDHLEPQRNNPYDRSYFEEKASYGQKGGYERMGGEARKWYRGWLRRARIPKESSGNALDCGCAYGYGCSVLAEWSFTAHGTDISEFAIDTARRLYPQYRFELADLQHTVPFAQTFDLIMSLDALEHMVDPLSALQNIRTMLSQNGILLITTPVPESRSPFRIHDPTHVNELPTERWVDLICEAGLRVLSSGQYHFVPLVHHVLPWSPFMRCWSPLSLASMLTATR